MTMKPFEIQGAQLKLGGVQLEAGTTGVVIPGVTRATSYKVEEVEDTGDQTQVFDSVKITVIDYITYQEILNEIGNGSGRADYITELDNEGYIDSLEVGGQGSYTQQEAADNASNDMYGYIGSGLGSDRPIVPQDWVQIPFRPKMRVGEVEREGGGGGATLLNELSDVALDGPSNGQVLMWNGDQEEWQNQTISGGGTSNRIDNGMSTVIIPTENGSVLINTNDDKEWQFLVDGSLMFPDGSIQTTAYVNNATPQKGFFVELSHPSDNNNVSGEAVVIDEGGNTYASYSYNDQNVGRNLGCITKLSATGEKLWDNVIISNNGNADYCRITSLEYSPTPGGDFLVALGTYWDNSVSRNVGFMYLIDPESGSTGSPFDTEVSANYSVNLSDGVFGADPDNNPFAVLAGNSSNEVLQKTLTPLAPSTVDKLYISWTDYNNLGMSPNEQLYYTVGGYYGVYVNAASAVVSPDGTGDGIWLTVSVTPDNTYTITRVNGWSGAIYSWDNNVTLRMLGSNLGGVDGVNDLTFDLDKSIFNYDSSNFISAVSNIQGTPINDVLCTGWNGKDWGADIGNQLTLDYQLNNQGYISRLGNNSWSKSIGDADSESINSVDIDSNGNVYAGGYYYDGISRSGLVIKYDISGNQQWAVFIDPSDNMGITIHSVEVLADGNIICIGDNAIITKIDSSNGNIIWQVENTNRPSWDSDFRGAATSDGDYIFSNYESNNYTLYVVRISGNDGSTVWVKQISRFFNGQNGELYPQNDFDAHYISCNSTHVSIALSTYLYYNNNGTTNGLIINIPIDGIDVDGVYGQYTIATSSLDWINESTSAVEATVNTLATSETGNQGNPSTDSTTITFSKTNIGGDNTPAATFPGIERFSASQGDDNITLSLDQNGKFLYYNGSNGNSWIYLPSNDDVALPIGFTVSVVMDYFNNNRIYVNNNTGSQNATVNASGFQDNTTNYWIFGATANKCGVYTIMKVDTDRWMLAGPDVTAE